MYKVSSKCSATYTTCHVLQPYFVNLALTLCSKAGLKSQNPKRLRRKARRDQAYHSAWLSSETMARWRQGDLCVIHASGHSNFRSLQLFMKSRPLSNVSELVVQLSNKWGHFLFPHHKDMKITDYTNEKGGGYSNNKMSAAHMEIWVVLLPPSSLSWSGPVSVPLQHKIEEGHSMQIKLCIIYTSWKLGKCWIHCYQTLKCYYCHQKSGRNLMMYSNQAQSYVTDEGNTSSIFGLLASHFKSRLWFEDYTNPLHKQWHKTSSMSFKGRFTDLLLPLPWDRTQPKEHRL